MGRTHINILYKSRSLNDKACRWKMPLSNLANLEDLWSLSRHPTEPPLWSDLLNFQFMLARWYNNPKSEGLVQMIFLFQIGWSFSSREFFSECIAPSKACNLVIWDGSESQQVCRLSAWPGCKGHTWSIYLGLCLPNMYWGRSESFYVFIYIFLCPYICIYSWFYFYLLPNIVIGIPSSHFACSILSHLTVILFLLFCLSTFVLPISVHGAFSHTE